jgi:hypothetical protein
MKRLIPILLALTGCAEITDLLTHDARIPDDLGVHVHPVQTTAAEVEEVCNATSRIRMEVPGNVVHIVTERVTNAPEDCRFLLVVEETLPLSFWDFVRADDRIEAIQVGNELDNCQPGFACWDPATAAKWLGANLPWIREVAGGKTIVGPATTPLWQDWDKTFQWFVSLAETNVLAQCDVLALHAYGKPWTSPERWHALYLTEELVKRLGLPVWVTEYGTPEDSEEVEYAAKLPAVMPWVDRWYWYAWNDETLGYSLRTGPSPLWKELR